MAEMRWGAWGTAADRVTLPDGVRDLLWQGLGVEPNTGPTVAESEVELPDPRLPRTAHEALAGVLGSENVRTDRDSRLSHVGGKSTIDLWRRRSGDAAAAPDAVVLPASHDEVRAVLELCARHRVAVVPFGGGTSVVGGVEPVRDGFDAVIALDLRRMSSLVAVDERSSTARLQPGLTGPQAERLLNECGLTLGHFPQSFEFASIGGFAATRSAGQASSGYGRFDDLVVGLRVATPAGEVELGRGPASAAGPDLRQLFLGSEGVLGVITEVTVRVRPAPARVVDEAWAFDDFTAGVDAVRRLAQADLLATVTRLSDEAETAVNLAMGAESGGPSPTGGGCLLIAGHEGTEAEVAAARAASAGLLTDAGGRSLGTEAARGWRAGRYRGPYLRDALMDAGALVETLETATTWTGLDDLYTGVRDAVTAALTDAGTPPMVMCHLSHAYPTGASLYFTVVANAASDPIAQWTTAKRAAGDAISARGGTITHHHAVGMDHRPWMAAEIGPLGIDVLRAVKATVDPAGIMNPGKLIPPLA